MDSGTTFVITQHKRLSAHSHYPAPSPPGMTDANVAMASHYQPYVLSSEQGHACDAAVADAKAEAEADPQQQFLQMAAKKRKLVDGCGLLDVLPEDVLLVVLGKLVRTARRPADVMSVLLTCRRLCSLGTKPEVLRQVCSSALRMSAGNWTVGAHRFLRRCAMAGNADACYSLGMVLFYCLEDLGPGISYLAEAALKGHADALHSLALIHFNGSGGTRMDRDLASGVFLCARAAALGHVEALRELGHCLQDGYGLPTNPALGRRLLMEANVREAAQVAAAATACCHGSKATAGKHTCCRSNPAGCCSNGSSSRRGQEQGSAGKKRRRLVRSLSSPAKLGAEVASAAAAGHGAALGTKVREVPDEAVASAPRTAGGGIEEAVGGERREAGGLVRLNSREVEEEAAAAMTATAAHGYDTLGASTGVPGAGTNSRSSYNVSVGGSRCCCLPTVSMSLESRPDGWVRAFLVDWHMLRRALMAPSERTGRGDMQACSYAQCGRVELRSREFRCCSACGEARYCSRACQAQDWKAVHKYACAAAVAAAAALAAAAAAEAAAAATSAGAVETSGVGAGASAQTQTQHEEAPVEGDDSEGNAGLQWEMQQLLQWQHEQ